MSDHYDLSPLSWSAFMMVFCGRLALSPEKKARRFAGLCVTG